MPKTQLNQECRQHYTVEADERPGRVIHPIVRDLADMCGSEACFDHVSPIPFPSPEAIVELVEITRRILFPGYFTQNRIDPVNLEYELGQEVTILYQKLSNQITWAVRHDCYRHELECTHCSDQGKDKTLEFINKLPGLRKMLGTDVRAAFEGDPAGHSYDQIISSYPGVFAVAVHRIAHELQLLEVPLLPRMMSEYAHGRTGIDIHPGARIGPSFFIDHGTGVVIGETTVIGERVRMYQGVTLGALSLPPGAGLTLKGKKRHPTIEEDVILYAGATVLGGDTVIGARSIIGGNVWLTESVPPDTKVILKNPELIFMGKKT